MINILSHMKVLISLVNLESYLLKILFHSSYQWRVSLSGKNYLIFSITQIIPQLPLHLSRHVLKFLHVFFNIF